jgi:hypothetical protein
MMHNFNEDELYAPEMFFEIERSIEANAIRPREQNGRNMLLVPLKIRTTKVGCLLLADRGELPFRGPELRIVRALRLHLTSILMRIKEFQRLKPCMQMFQLIMTVTQEFFRRVRRDQAGAGDCVLRHRLTAAPAGSSSKRTPLANYVYQVALDDSKQPLTEFTT